MYTMLFKREARMVEPRRNEILEAALRIVADGGPDAITFRRVADRAGVPLGSLTYYFDSREDLLREAFRLYLSEAAAFVRDVEEGSSQHTPAQVIEMVMTIMRREFSDDPAMVRVEYELILYADREPELAREFNAYERWMETKLAGLLEAIGTPRPIDAARTIIDVARGFEIERLTHPDARLEDLQRRLRLVIDALVNERPAPVQKSRRERSPDPRRRSAS